MLRAGVQGRRRSWCPGRGESGITPWCPMAPDLSYEARSLGRSRQAETAKVLGERRKDMVRVTMLYSLRFFLLVAG
jgi:hypothetical protein